MDAGGVVGEVVSSSCRSRSAEVVGEVVVAAVVVAVVVQQ